MQTLYKKGEFGFQDTCLRRPILPYTSSLRRLLSSRVMEEKQEQLKKLVEILRETFSEEELKEMKDFLARIVDRLIGAYLDGGIS